MKSINLRDIKSSDTLKGIFSFLDERQKLNMLIYNKELQNKLLVNIEDYKKTSGKYKIGDKNGKGKEFILNTNKLIFDGEYLNGRRNGYGKEYYDNGKIKFEGEFFNGQRNGKGKEYDKNGILLFEGEYLNGEKCNGKGKEYDNNGKVIFDGDYSNGVKYNKIEENVR